MEKQYLVLDRYEVKIKKKSGYCSLILDMTYSQIEELSNNLTQCDEAVSYKGSVYGIINSSYEFDFVNDLYVITLNVKPVSEEWKNDAKACIFLT